MTGRLRVVMIEAEGETAQATIEAAMAVFGAAGPAPSAVALPAVAPAPALAAPHRGAKGARVARKPRAAAAAETFAEPATANGVTVAGNVVSYGGKSITVTAGEAALAAELAKVMPNVGDRDRLVKALWGRVDESTRNMLGQRARALNESVEAIGLKVTSVRGIGVCMAVG